MDTAHVFITAETLIDRCQNNAIGIELRDLTGQIRAYEVHARTGPWLMTCADWQHYRHLCNHQPQPHPITSLS